MSVRGKKKHAKAVARRKKLAEERRRFDQLARKHEFPRLVVLANDAPPAFVEAVRRAYPEIDFRDTSLFQPWEQVAYRAFAAGGEWDTVLTKLGQLHFIINLGNQVYRRIPNLLDFIPYHDVLF